jgi:hypothetical protein
MKTNQHRKKYDGSNDDSYYFPPPFQLFCHEHFFLTQRNQSIRYMQSNEILLPYRKMVI